MAAAAEITTYVQVRILAIQAYNYLIQQNCKLKENQMGKTKSKIKKKKRYLEQKAIANGTAKKK